MSLAERLKTARIDAGLSQKELAEKLEMPLRTYGSYERGERDISTAILLNICKTLNISSDYLLGREFWDNEPENEQEQTQTDMIYSEKTEGIIGGDDLIRELIAEGDECMSDGDYKQAAAIYHAALGINPAGRYTHIVTHSYYKGGHK